LESGRVLDPGPLAGLMTMVKSVDGCVSILRLCKRASSFV